MYWFLKKPAPFPHSTESVLIILEDTNRMKKRPNEESVFTNMIKVVKSTAPKMQIHFLYFDGIKKRYIANKDISAARDSDNRMMAHPINMGGGVFVMK